MHRLWSKAALVVGLGLLASLPARPAAAQSGLDPTAQLITDRSHQDIDDHLDWINHKDCVDNAFFEFTLATTGTIPLSADLHVWASTAGALCEDPNVRDDATCKQVYVGDAYALGQAVAAKVMVRDILRPETGVLPPDTDTPETVCDQGIEDKTDVVLRFFLLDSGGNTFPGVTTYPVSYDLVGPEPPTSVKAGVGESALVVSWEASSSDEFLGLYNVYADEVGGTETDGGVGAGGASSGQCSSDELIPGEIPTGDYRAQTNASTTKAEAGGLTNGVTYAVGVASIDNFNNPGPLSSLSCGTPEPVTGFFEAYRDAGGEGGGGFCSLGARPSQLAAAFVALAALGFAARRRRGHSNPRRTP
jgi:hypothetical protein